MRKHFRICLGKNFLPNEKPAVALRSHLEKWPRKKTQNRRRVDIAATGYAQTQILIQAPGRSAKATEAFRQRLEAGPRDNHLRAGFCESDRLSSRFAAVTGRYAELARLCSHPHKASGATAPLLFNGVLMRVSCPRSNPLMSAVLFCRPQSSFFGFPMFGIRRLR